MANVGIDVSKDHLDWTADTDAPVQRVANRPAGVRGLVRRLSGFEVERVVVEATGGYERLLVEEFEGVASRDRGASPLPDLLWSIDGGLSPGVVRRVQIAVVEVDCIQDIDTSASGEVVDQHPTVAALPDRQTRPAVVVCRAPGHPGVRPGLADGIEPIKEALDGATHRAPRTTTEPPRASTDPMRRDRWQTSP